MQLVDSHCHLDDAQFDSDRETVINRARDAGLKYMLAIGTGNGPPDLEAAIRLAEAYSPVYATVGVHPNDALKVGPNTFHDLERLLQHPKVKALGEIGLDYHWGVPKESQRPIFLRQLEIAAGARMPVVIHTRDAWADTIEALRMHWAPTGLACIMHCFTGDAEQAEECLSMGFYLAFGGVTTFPKAAQIREAARITPADRLLLETDAPYLAPVPHRGKRNEPAFVAHTAQVVAAVRDVAVEELAAQTTANFERLFQL
ncbi:MAG TPA: TatD family hydrolase [Bryobacteraceae bacterium]|nr:TatD family hydrolase [Bryobacteraceae bacterium]